MTLEIRANKQRGWIVIRVEPNIYGGEDRILLGEIVYIDVDGPDLGVRFKTRIELFQDHQDEMEVIKYFMGTLTVDLSA